MSTRFGSLNLKEKLSNRLCERPVRFKPPGAKATTSSTTTTTNYYFRDQNHANNWHGRADSARAESARAESAQMFSGQKDIQASSNWKQVRNRSEQVRNTKKAALA